MSAGIKAALLILGEVVVGVGVMYLHYRSMNPPDKKKRRSQK